MAGQRKGGEKDGPGESGRLMVGGAMVPRSAGGTDMLVGVIFATRAFGCGKLEGEANWGTIVFADKLAISRPRERLCTFRRNLFRAVGVFVTDTLANETGGTRMLVVPKGIVSGVATQLAVVRRGMLRFGRFVKGGGRVDGGVTVARKLELEETLLVLVHRDDRRRVRSVLTADVDVKPQNGGEVVQKLALASEKAKVGGPHALGSGTLTPTDPFQIALPG